MIKQLTYKGSEISYHTYGAGIPVIFIHGFGEDNSIWDDQVDFLKKDFRLIVPDLPGSGRSEMLWKEDAVMDDYADLVKAILDEERIVPATTVVRAGLVQGESPSCGGSPCTKPQLIMIGHSMGGYITLAFAEKYPQYLKAFGLFHSGAYADDAEKIATRKKAIQFIEQNGSAAFLKTSIPGLFFDPGKSRQDIEKLTAKGNSFLPEELIQYYQAMIARPDRTAVLKTFERPILFIIGEHDKAIPFKHSLEQSHMPAKAHISILRKSAHMGMLEEAAKATEILAQFLHSL